MKKTKKKAFTLTELLVVVIVIGVLAAVTLPSFNKVLETRKTTEAEDVLSALRTEQEYRCAMEKPYAADLNQLDTLASNTKKNFDYKISTEGSGSSAKVTGSEAVSKGKYNYTLRMPSYADGRMCCEGTDCGKLNKDYPLCSVLKARADYKQVPANCAPDADGLGDSGDVPHGDKCGEMPADLVKYQQCQAVGGVGMCGREVKKPVCDQSTDYKWKEGNEWDKSACTKADADEVKPKSCAAGKCGTITTTATCNATGETTWAWTYTSDEATACTTKSDETETCSDGTVRTRKYTCENDKWVLGDWDKECPEEKETYTCQTATSKLGYRCAYNSYFNTKNANAKFTTDVTQSVFQSQCCTCETDYVLHNGTCKTCGDLHAPSKNWKYQNGTCVQAFTAKETNQHVYIGGSYDSVYHMGTTSWCWGSDKSVTPYLTNPNPINACGSYSSVQSLCDANCDASEGTCVVGCYDSSSLSDYKKNLTTYTTTYTCQSSPQGKGGFVCSNYTAGMAIDGAVGGCNCALHDNARVPASANTACSSCGGPAQQVSSFSNKVVNVSCKGQGKCWYCLSGVTCSAPVVNPGIHGYMCGSMTAKGSCSGDYGYY